MLTKEINEIRCNSIIKKSIEDAYQQGRADYEKELKKRYCCYAGKDCIIGNLVEKDAYQQGRNDAISDMLKVIDCENTDCEDCIFFDYKDDLGQLVTYCKFKREVQIKEKKND